MEKETKKKIVVIALGGNALGKNLEEQRRDKFQLKLLLIY